MTKPARRRVPVAVIVPLLSLLPGAVPAALAQAARERLGTLGDLSASFQALADKVKPAVVQIFVQGLAPGRGLVDASDLLSAQSSVGSGVILDPAGYVVTNAHVVAGVDDPIVRGPDQDSRHGTTVLFDPDLDLAILHVPNWPGRVLPLTPGDVERGEVGAVLGYPGGGPLAGGGAAVLRSFEPLGRDIYGTQDVVRLVLELQAVVRPGNSGGPFVLTDGSVAGVVFAASSAEEDIGYAIAAEEVRPRLAEVVGATAEVETGPCVG